MDLTRRIRDVLAAMSVLAAADSQSFVTFNPNGSHDTQIPAGVRTSASLATISSTDPRTLFDHWRGRFARAQEHGVDDRHLHALVLVAEAELDAARHRIPSTITAEHPEPGQATEERCLDLYAGVDLEEAASIEAAIYGGGERSVRLWLRRLRVRNDRDPDRGLPRPTGEGRLRRVAELLAAGCSQRAIARELGVSKTTVTRAVHELEQRRHRTRRAA